MASLTKNLQSNIANLVLLWSGTRTIWSTHVTHESNHEGASVTIQNHEVTFNNTNVLCRRLDQRIHTSPIRGCRTSGKLYLG